MTDSRNKKQLTMEVKQRLEAEKIKLTEKQVAKTISVICDTISDFLIDGNKVKIANFGTYIPKRIKEALRNNFGGEKILAQSYLIPSFVGCERLKERMNA